MTEMTCPRCGGCGEEYSKVRDQWGEPVDSWPCSACNQTGMVPAEAEEQPPVGDPTGEALLASLTRLYGAAGARRILDSEPPF